MATTAVVSTWYEKLFLGGWTLMRLREHPKIQWPPRWSERGESSLRGQDFEGGGFYRTEQASSKQRSERKNLFCRTILLQHGFRLQTTRKTQAHFGATDNRSGGTRFLEF